MGQAQFLEEDCDFYFGHVALNLWTVRWGDPHWALITQGVELTL